MILHIYTIIHTLMSFVAIFTGFVVLFGLFAGQRLDGWTKWFLITAVATTVTGFFFTFHGLTPAFKLGIISAFVLAITIYARYPRQLDGAWRWIYVDRCGDQVPPRSGPARFECPCLKKRVGSRCSTLCRQIIKD
jgi:hypothetical protein